MNNISIVLVAIVAAAAGYFGSTMTKNEAPAPAPAPAPAAEKTETASVEATLNAVKAKGFVQCGVSQGLPGFSNADDAGNWTGIDVAVLLLLSSAMHPK